MRKLISVVLSHQVRGNWLRRPQEVAAGKQAASRPRKDAGGGGPAEGTREGAAGTRTPHLGRLSIQLPSPISITQASTHGPAQARAPPKGGIRPPAAAQPAVRAFPARTPPPPQGDLTRGPAALPQSCGAWSSVDTRVVVSPPADAGPSHHGGFWRAPKGSRRLRAQEASSPEQGAGQGAQAVLHVPLGLAHHRGGELS